VCPRSGWPKAQIAEIAADGGSHFEGMTCPDNPRGTMGSTSRSSDGPWIIPGIRPQFKAGAARSTAMSSTMAGQWLCAWLADLKPGSHHVDTVVSPMAGGTGSPTVIVLTERNDQRGLFFFFFSRHHPAGRRGHAAAWALTWQSATEPHKCRGCLHPLTGPTPGPTLEVLGWAAALGGRANRRR